MDHYMISGLKGSLATVGIMFICTTLVACTSDADQTDAEKKNQGVAAVTSGSKPVDSSSDQASERTDQAADPYREQIYQTLLAETYYQKKSYQQASQLYSQLLTSIGTSAIAQRATELAIKSGHYKEALIAAQQWKSLQPATDEVNQYLMLLYQQDENYTAAAGVLAEMVTATLDVAKDKSVKTEAIKALDVAVAMLEREADMGAAYYTLKHYLQQFPAAQADNARYYRALFAMRANLYDEVIVATEPLSEIADKELQRKAALLRVKAYSALNKPQQALRELKQLIREAADPETQQDYARVMASLGKTAEAVALLEQVYSSHPENTGLLLDMIAINMGEKRYAESLPLIDKLQAVKGQRFNAHYFRGLIFEAQEKYSKALLEYRAIDEQSNNVKVPLRIATLLRDTEGMQSSLAYLHKREQQAGENKLKADLLLLESELLRKDKRFQEALVANKKAEQLFPQDLDIIYSQALLYEDVDQIQKSEEKLKKILSIDDSHSAALNALGYLLSVHTLRLDEAYGYIKKAYELKPDDPAIIDSLGWVAYRKGDLEDAEHYLRLAFKKLPDPEVASHLVEVLAKQGEQDEALKLLNEMLKKHPKNEQLMQVQSVIKK